jgi:hypothetical protein
MTMSNIRTPPPEYLALEVRRFLRKHDIPPTRFGREAVDDPNFPTDLFNGRIARPKTAAKVRAYIAAKSGGRDHG